MRLRFAMFSSGRSFVFYVGCPDPKEKKFSPSPSLPPCPDPRGLSTAGNSELPVIYQYKVSVLKL